MKILVVTREHEVERRYGLGRSVLPVLTALESRGLPVTYLCQADLGPRARLWMARINAWMARLARGRRGATDLAGLVGALVERFNMGRVASRLARRDGFTHVHCHDPLIARGFLFFAGLRPFHRFRGAWGVSQHGYGCYAQSIHEDGAPLGTRAMRWMRRMETGVLLKADWVVCPTRASLRQMARDLGVHPVPDTWRAIHHARPAVSLHDRGEARRRLGWDPDTYYIVGVGRLAPVKNFPLLIDACARLKGERATQLVILGDGHRQPLLDHARRAGLRPDPVFDVTDDVGPYLAAADLYVSASRSESFGLAALEAMLAGTPVVCTAVGGVPEVVGGAGRLVAADDADVLAVAIASLMSNPDAAGELAAAGLRRATEWPDAEACSRRYEEIYREAGSRRTPG